MPTEHSNTSDESKQLVLIIDDSKDVHRLLKARLRQEDLDFASAESGLDGIKLANERQPSLILLDLDMPGMDGYEVLRALKDSKVTRDIPVIILSGMQGAHDKVAAFDLGAIDYVTKPFDLAELRARVRSSLRLNQLVRMLAQRAQIDGLTGLWNRAAFDRRWAEEYARCIRHGHPLALALLDIDHFKSINDTFGHPAGDAVLIGLSKLLGRELRSSDVACRYGGEEFAIIMPDTNPDAARQTCERLRAALEAFAWPRHPERKVTMSIGCVGSDRAPGVSSEKWIELVDQNLYAAKRSGRNRVSAANLSEIGDIKIAI
jgi:two-component system, cell cycle response regulator